MQQSTPRSRALRLIAALGAPVLVAAAACSSSGSSGSSVPQGLSGTEAGAGATQISAADAAAATTLTPAAGSFLAGKGTVTVLGSTTPTNGDENPYAIWPVTETVGSVKSGDVLIDNFNNSSNNQGTGTTIVDLHADGTQSVFAQLPQSLSGCTGGVGLTTAMVQLKTGWVIVGSLPSSDGKTATAAAGCLIVLSPAGKVAETLSEPYLQGPWDATVRDDGNTASLFVANTLVGVTASTTGKVDQGDVVRLSLSQTSTSAPKITAESVVATGFPESPDAAAFIKGPTGLALSSGGTLYVADNLGNRIAAIPSALTRTSADPDGSTLTSGGQLSGPLGLVVAPNGDLLAANATNGKIVEITPAGKQVGEYYADDSIGQDPPGNGDLFDVAITQDGKGVLFVNDGTNILQELH
jgi:hypothetical protein